ncbi:MAG: hypothetical protein ACE5FF_00520 [Saprospiraceae bacterium]
MKKIALKYSLKMFAGFAALFAVVHLLGFSHHYYLRVFNGFIHLTIIYLAIRQYRREVPAMSGNYIAAVAMGMYTSMIAVTLFAFCMWVFLSLDVNQAFFSQLQANAPFPEFFTPFAASLVIFAEGIGVSLVGSYLITRVIDASLEGAGPAGA